MPRLFNPPWFNYLILHHSLSICRCIFLRSNVRATLVSDGGTSWGRVRYFSIRQRIREKITTKSVTQRNGTSKGRNVKGRKGYWKRNIRRNSVEMASSSRVWNCWCYSQCWSDVESLFMTSTGRYFKLSSPFTVLPNFWCNNTVFADLHYWRSDPLSQRYTETYQNAYQSYISYIWSNIYRAS